MLERGRTWLSGIRWCISRSCRTPLTITWAEVATHNHFALDRGGKVFKQTAPVIKLPEAATEQDHLRLLGLLNSSTACFWLKQVCHNKGGRSARGSSRDEKWERLLRSSMRAKLEQFPLPDGLPMELARDLDALATELQTVRPSAVAAESVPTRAGLDAARAEWERIRSEMISAQEELDWEVYGLYGLLGDDADDLIGPGDREAAAEAWGAGIRDRAGADRWPPAKPRPSGSTGTGRPRSPTCLRTGPPSTGRWWSGGWRRSPRIRTCT